MDFPTLAAGGIVVRHDSVPRFAIVRLRKGKAWVLPKGKLNRDETARDAARREVMEETGHQVSVHEYVGALAYPVGGKPKVVQFWRMQASGTPKRKLMHDVSAVEFLPLREAVERLTRPYERVFLEFVGPVVLRTIAALERKRVARKLARAAEIEKRARKAKRARKKTKRRPVIAAGLDPMIEANGDEETAAARRPWLQRYVLGPLLNPESLRR
jgi:8-oxo-dGTP diphosphatase